MENSLLITYFLGDLSPNSSTWPECVAKVSRLSHIGMATCPGLQHAHPGAGCHRKAAELPKYIDWSIFNFMTSKGDLTKERLAQSMLELIQTSGYSGTGLNAVIDHATAPKGSVYFHFPDGKEALGVAAVELATKQFESMILQAAQSAGGAAEAAKIAIQTLATIIGDSDFRLGCPVSVVTLEMGDSSERLRQACATAFESWIAPTATLLEADGVNSAQAKSLATVIVSTIEGAAIVSRAMKSTQPLLAAAEVVGEIIGRRRQGEGSQK